MFYTKYFYDQNWNIGFSEDTIETLFVNKALGKVQWMKHNYHDRFFADPFILETTEKTIILLAEEFIFAESKGKIVRLIIDKKDKKLLERIIVLDLDTHLSYPFIIRMNEQIFICPENSQSGKVSLYLYDKNNHYATYYKTLIKEPLTDATITFHKGKYWLIATKQPYTQENAYLFFSDSLEGEYSLVNNLPIITDKKSARPAGNFFYYQDKLYRPSQNCMTRYGSGISIQKIEMISENNYKEHTLFQIHPSSFEYNLGIHTINFFENGCVIDGCGYLYPLCGRILKYFIKIKNKITCQYLL